MVSRIVAVSGPVAVGKSILVNGLIDGVGAIRLSTRELIQRKIGPSAPTDRAGLQRAGDRLDRMTNGSWVADEVGKIAADLPGHGVLVVDSCRILPQIDGLRHAFGSRVVHIHLTAPLPVLEARYNERRNTAVEELPTYAEVRRNRTERNVERLADLADLVIDTERSSAADVVARAIGAVGLRRPTSQGCVDVLVGGQYGSEGKGNIVAHIGPEYDLIIRVGGPNAGHKVKFGADGAFTHHHLPSATRTSSGRLALAPGALLHEAELLREIAECGVEADRLSIDPQTMVITEEHRERERDLMAKISSTGRGVGAASSDKIMNRSTYEKARFLARDSKALEPFIRPLSEVLRQSYASGERILVEGVQGSMLSIHHGLYPHVTSRDTTISGTLAEAGIPPSYVRRSVVVCRTYPIRVQNAAEGSSGWMAKEISLEEISSRSGIPIEELRETERTSTTKRARRIAEFDWDLLLRTTLLNGPTDIALTFVDYLDVKNRNARRYEQLTGPTIMFIEEVERVARAPVSLISTRFHARSVIDRRRW